MLPINKKISNYNYSSRQGSSVKYIVLHYTGNYTDTAKNNVDYFYGGNRNASAGYFVDDDSIWQSVEDSNSSWAVGDGAGKYGIQNRNSISIEMCCTRGVVSEKTEANALELTKYLMNKYNVPVSNVVRHYDASRKICPNWSANSWLRWNNFKAKLSGNTTVQPPTQPTVNPVQEAKDFVGSRCLELQTKLIALGYDCGGYGADGKFGQGTYNSLIKFQRDHGLVADGLAGSNTFNKLNALLTKPNTGDDWIRRLQTECNNQGFSNQKVDGFAGSNTLAGCPTIRQGASGNITKLLQERLGISADGKFGPATRNAVVEFQKSKGLTRDGVVGQGTWKKLLGM